jgi:hypothetical protein
VTTHDERTAMSVQQQLGLEQDSLLVQQIREGWSTWCADDDRLAVVDEFDRFRYWLRTVGVDESDGALHALARLGARDGGDDVIAGAALAWALLPGAATLAARLTDISASIDELVAAQLWIEVRSFPWKRRRRVAANVLISTRAGVLHDLGVIAQVIRTDRVWANTGLLLDGDPEVAWSVSGGDCALRARVREQLSVDFYAEPTPAQEVEALLAWGVREALISDRDRLLLTELVGQAETTTRPVRGRAANGGLAGREVTRRVGSRLGVSPATVRRRVASSVTALVAASDRYVA